MEAAYFVMVIFRVLQVVRPISLTGLSLFEKAQTLINSWIGQEIYMIYLFIYHQVVIAIDYICQIRPS